MFDLFVCVLCIKRWIWSTLIKRYFAFLLKKEKIKNSAFLIKIQCFDRFSKKSDTSQKITDNNLSTFFADDCFYVTSM